MTKNIKHVICHEHFTPSETSTDEGWAKCWLELQTSVLTELHKCYKGERGMDAFLSDAIAGDLPWGDRFDGVAEAVVSSPAFPAFRALFEKTYGPGSAQWLDKELELGEL